MHRRIWFCGSDNDVRLWQHIAQLPERCRALLRVIAFADRPDYAAVAESLGMPIGSIGPTRGRCLAKLRLQLGQRPGMGELMSSPPPELDQLAAGADRRRRPARLAGVARCTRHSTPSRRVWWTGSASASPSTRCTAEIAELQRSNDLVGVRAQEAPVGSQTVTFTSSDLTTMVTITPSGADRVRIDGWVDPGAGVQRRAAAAGADAADRRRRRRTVRLRRRAARSRAIRLAPSGPGAPATRGDHALD